MATRITVRSGSGLRFLDVRLRLAIFLMEICEALEWLGYCLAGLVLGGEVIEEEDAD